MQAVASVNPNTIVVVHSVGPLIIEPWVENPNVTAILWAGVSGPETGNAITDVLYGAVNPSGHLPYTIAKNASDYPAQIVEGDTFLTVNYTEGLFIDYRHFDEVRCPIVTAFIDDTDASARRTSSRVTSSASGFHTRTSASPAFLFQRSMAERTRTPKKRLLGLQASRVPSRLDAALRCGCTGHSSV